MRRPALCLLTLLAAAPPLLAQSNTAEMLQRAVRLYEDVEIERALVLLRQIISPASPFEVSPQQRVEAFKYFGAALALQPGAAKRDSAITFFRAAIERDPFTDLDPRDFSPVQLEAFSEARNRTFGVGVRPVPADTISPGPDRVVFRGLSSHLARLRVELRSGDATEAVLFDGENEGAREILWDGYLTGGNLAPPGRYEIAVIGQSRLVPIADTVRVFFDLAHDHPPLEDTLDALGPGDLLPERHPASAATADLLKGMAVAAAAVAIQTMLAGNELGSGRVEQSGPVAAAGVFTGVVAFLYRQRNRDIPANIAANQRRREERRVQNAEILGRNAERLRETRLIVTPAGGGGQ